MRRFAISDIHGCKKTFEALLDRIALSTGDEVYLLGDYIDRGKDSKGVVDYIWKLQDQGYTVHCLMGNHEMMMLEADDGLPSMSTWLYNGGYETLESFGADSPSQIPDEYFHFFQELSFYEEVDEYILVHAGLDFETGDPLGDTESMIWIRDWYENIDREWLEERIIIHGHTPINRSQIQHLHANLDDFKVLDIDAGCVFDRPQLGVGYLCAFEMNSRELYFQKNIERGKQA